MSTRVLVLPEVRQYLRELIEILFDHEYFGFEETAVKYVEDLFEDIKVLLPTRSKRLAPAYFSRYGKDMYYCTFKKSKRTQWYVFFNIYSENGELLYLIRYISNNHMVARLL